MADDTSPPDILESVRSSPVIRKPDQENLSEHSVSASPSPKRVPTKERRGSQGTQHKDSGSGPAGGAEGHQKRGGGGGSTAATKKEGKRVSSSAVPEGSAVVDGGAGASGPQKKKTKPKYSVRKRAPPKELIDIKENDVFVSEKSHFVGQLSRCKKLFDKGNREIFLHGLGKAIPRAINIAFELKNFYHNSVDYTVNTSTVEVYDDIICVDDPEQQPVQRSRNVSSVDIRIYRCVNIP
ncbi:unnamed protein product [Orchesella dallaii]|uniref:Uncharacterized protein n=1 Tax=Orchesella dallaii TaxID=48710 RepID=A0ABP1S220_9HEXA